MDKQLKKKQNPERMLSRSCTWDMASSGSDQQFTEVISQQMRIPEHLRVGVGSQREERAKLEDTTLVYRMHIPDRLSLADAPDLNPRPLFSTPSKHSFMAHTVAGWDSLAGEPQSPLRRSYSDQMFGRSPPVTPMLSKQTLHAPSLHAMGCAPQSIDPLRPPAFLPDLLSPQNVLQAVRDLGKLASQHVLRTVTQKYGSRFKYSENPCATPAEMPGSAAHSRKSTVQDWLNADEESGGSVEFLLLRRQMVKMSRRLAALERQNAEHRQTEMILFSLLLSACFFNGWLWLRR
ncbi:fetal and adult testis-expressed transcript protein [Arapaima gigas]